MHRDVLASAPPDSFFSEWAETYNFKFQERHDMPPWFESAGAYAPRLHTPLNGPFDVNGACPL